MRELMKTITKIFLVAGAVWIGSIALGGVLMAVLKPGFPPGPEGAEVLVPMAWAQLLTVCALWWPATASTLPRRKLFFALFSAIFGIGVFLVQVEAAVFLVMETRQLAFSVIFGTLQALGLAALVTFGVGRAVVEIPNRGPGPKWAGMGKQWLLTSCFYAFLYFTAGMMIYAQVAEFYAQQRIPPMSVLVPLQLVRGALYVFFVRALLGGSALTRAQAAWATGFMFPVLAGVAALMVPNSLMPESVRYWHMLEIGISNLIFGLWVGYTFAPRPHSTSDTPLQPATSGRRPEVAGVV